MRADPFTCADVVAEHRRRPGAHRYRAPIDMPKTLAGHMPDPRTIPFDARRTGFVIRTIIQFAVCAFVVVVVWTALV